ncbi:hypothetical protein AVEN_7172-1 [Araneus ventricosus]|uniref:Uncharacterized protein n=1 Tax=Araneus ventricosus TaxID=182803 RepID=A0A4Y2GW90_ARAVE|nr:hypothetical protein AVEN_7172-1 [Araneus ventricosus]
MASGTGTWGGVLSVYASIDVYNVEPALDHERSRTVNQSAYQFTTMLSCVIMIPIDVLYLPSKFVRGVSEQPVESVFFLYQYKGGKSLDRCLYSFDAKMKLLNRLYFILSSCNVKKLDPYYKYGEETYARHFRLTRIKPAIHFTDKLDILEHEKEKAIKLYGNQPNGLWWLEFRLD